MIATLYLMLTLLAPLPAPVDAALREAEATPKLQVSFSMRFAAAGNAPVTMRFDARTRDWTTLDGDMRQLSPDAQQKLRNVMKSESAPGGLLYADFRPHLTEVMPAGQTAEGHNAYTFVPPEAAGKKTADAANLFRTRIEIADGVLVLYEVRALQPVSPMPMTRFDTFLVRQEFARISAEGPVLLSRMVNEQRGQRVGKTVDVAFTASFFDYEIIR